MGKQMWFGNEQRFQWVPCPSAGMSAGNVGYTEQIDLQTGRKSVYRTHQTHKEFEVNFPVQEAAGASGLDVFGRYASGLYGDCDDYPLYFADPMNYDQNLFPPGWASPGLYARGWDSIGSVEQAAYYNYAKNPSLELNSTGYAAVAGTGGTASGARSSSGTGLVSGSWNYRVTWTVATSAVSGGINYTGTTVTPGKTYSFLAHVTNNKTQRVRMDIRWRDSAGGSISTVAGTETVFSSVTPLTILNQTAPDGAATVDIEIAAVPGTSGTNWAASDFMVTDAIMISDGTATSPVYFDGSHAGAGWLGTANASGSYIFVIPTAPTVSSTPANVYQVPTLQTTYDIKTVPNAYPTPDNSMGRIPYAIIPIPPGYTLHMGATGSATGTARVAVHLFNAPGDPTTPALATSLTLLSSSGSTRLNASFSGASYQYAKVFLQRTSTATSTITLSSMIAQLWPVTYSPVVTGNFIPGQGHLGLKFADNANTESYQIVDLQRNVPIHYKGLNTRLVESQEV